MDQLLELLFKFLIVSGIAASLTLTSFFIWSALFIPIVKLRQHNMEKEKQQKEAIKIEIRKAESILMIEEKKKEYEEIVLMTEAKKREYQKLSKKEEAAAETKASKTKTK